MYNDEKKLTYFITGGGTGGHIYPAVAVADALYADEQTKDLYYIGNPANLEYDIVKQKGYKFLPVSVKGMPRKFGFGFVKWSFELYFAWLKSCYYLWKYKPDVVFGTGGYVSAPILLACMSFVRGTKKRIPYMLHDCDAQPGLVTRKLAPTAKAVSLAFECAEKHVNNKNCKINGNPIREKFKTLSRSMAREALGLSDKTTICIMGGSQGAKSINDASVKILKTLTADMDLQVIFQTGKKNYDSALQQLSNIYPEYQQNKNIIIKPYFDDMITVLKASDIAVSRSGSLSLSEISASGLASILIPYPHAAADHQRKNAKYMTEKGASLYLEDFDANEETLLKLLNELLTNREKLKELQDNALKLAKYDGAVEIVKQLKEIVQLEKV